MAFPIAIPYTNAGHMQLVQPNPCSPTIATSIPMTGLVVAGRDDDGEDILVEEDPTPNEIAADPVLRCRYPSKHCLRARSVKKTGALHSMCLFHRAKANRNQRRLEKRKRLRAASVESHSTKDWLLQPPLRPDSRLDMFPLEMDGKTSPRASVAKDSQRQSPRQAVDLEPFLTPEPLQLEDLKELCELVNGNVQGV